MSQQYINAKVTGIARATPSIKTLQLELEDGNYQFQPGQWIQLQIPERPDLAPGFYSITSIPSELPRLEIAVKQLQDFPITNYLHEHLHEQQNLLVSMAQGGIDVSPLQNKNWNFIAGGVGITPFYSMIRYHLEQQADLNVHLLYSVRTAAECLFYEELYDISQNNNRFSWSLVCTQEHNPNPLVPNRIDQQLLAKHFQNQASFFLCGPPRLVEQSEQHLLNLGAKGEQVHYEKWW